MVLAVLSKSVTRGSVDGHRWAGIFVMWNMPSESFQELYNLLPDPKPPFEEVWMLTGGSPRMLEDLYRVGWAVVNKLFMIKNLSYSFIRRWREHLERAVEDPDYLWFGPDDVEALTRDLVERNLVAYHLSPRENSYWLDTPALKRIYRWELGDM